MSLVFLISLNLIIYIQLILKFLTVVYEICDYLSNDCDFKSGSSKGQHTAASKRKMMILEQSHDFEHNVLLFVAVNSNENLFFQHSCFNLRKWRSWSMRLGLFLFFSWAHLGIIFLYQYSWICSLPLVLVF